MPYNTISTFHINSGERYEGLIKILGADNQWHNTKILFDTGNDVTILTRQTANNLGFNPDHCEDDPYHPCRSFPVEGITDTPQYFKKIVNWIQIDNMRPTQIRMGLAVLDTSLSENLLGRQDILDNGKYEIDYSGTFVKFRERHSPVQINAGIGTLSHFVREGLRHYK